MLISISPFFHINKKKPLPQRDELVVAVPPFFNLKQPDQAVQGSLISITAKSRQQLLASMMRSLLQL
jgi:hypothetical protein